MESVRRLARAQPGDCFAREIELMPATYLVRIDDLCPAMNWPIWDRVEQALVETGVKPILAVVPDNQDRKLNVGLPNRRFWERVREWQARGWSIGVHGYQHLYMTHDAGLIGRNRYSEFAGLRSALQYSKIAKALDIFSHQSVFPDLFIAPAHSFDEVTLKVLAQHGLRYLSDGYSLFPHTDTHGILWVPQQLGAFRDLPAGVWTVCLHINAWRFSDVVALRAELERYRSRISTFDAVAKKYAGRNLKIMDRLSEGAIRAMRSLGSAVSQP
jgi:predicted deacetylase